MKRYLLGLFAVVLAVGFSAFTSGAKKQTTLASYYWYPVNAAGVVQDEAFDDANLRDKTFALANFTDCEDVATKPYCILGSTSNNLIPGVSTISSPAADATIRKTE